MAPRPLARMPDLTKPDALPARRPLMLTYGRQPRSPAGGGDGAASADQVGAHGAWRWRVLVPTWLAHAKR
jgi:hypothetical protein